MVLHGMASYHGDIVIFIYAAHSAPLAPQAIAGIAVGVIIFVIIVFVIIYFLFWRHRRSYDSQPVINGRTTPTPLNLDLPSQPRLAPILSTPLELLPPDSPGRESVGTPNPSNVNATPSPAPIEGSDGTSTQI